MIRAGLSTQIMAYIQDADGYLEPVGAIQSLSVTENNTLKRIGETRNPRTFEIIPQGQDMITLSIRRIVFDGLRLTHALGCGYTHIRSQRWPFDIVVFDRQHSDDSSVGVQMTFYRRCWFSNYTVDYRSDQYLITENATLECEYVNELYPVSSNYNERGLKLRIDKGRIEYSYDEAVQLGALPSAPRAENSVSQVPISGDCSTGKCETGYTTPSQGEKWREIPTDPVIDAQFDQLIKEQSRKNALIALQNTLFDNANMRENQP